MCVFLVACVSLQAAAWLELQLKRDLAGSRTARNGVSMFGCVPLSRGLAAWKLQRKGQERGMKSSMHLPG